ncbi:MAG: pyroglutamyl-peptidase I [Candidatus Limnocylindrales bacterium]
MIRVTARQSICVSLAHTAAMRILLTGFDPFGGRGVNPSWEATRLLEGERAGDATIDVLRVPVVWRESVAAIIAELEREPAAGLVIGGLSYGRDAVNVEAIAHAVGDVPWQSDNADRTLANERSDGDAGGPDALLATAPVRGIVSAVNGAGIPAVLSWDGGAYVSNATLYGALRYARDRGITLPTTYLHVPATPEMTTGTTIPSLPLSDIARALRIACQVIATHTGPDTSLRRWPSALPPLLG